MKEKNSINLEGIFYEKGHFKPLNSSDGNIDGEIAKLREIYMDAERDYFEYLLSSKKVFEKFELLLDESTGFLCNYALYLQSLIESGCLETEDELISIQSLSIEEREKYHLVKLEQAEALLCLVLAAIKDKAKIKEIAYGRCIRK